MSQIMKPHLPDAVPLNVGREIVCQITQYEANVQNKSAVEIG